jgi:hypothetical protein
LNSKIFILDFYQIHSYQWQGKYGEFSPFEKSFADLKLDKPAIIGEFSICNTGRNATHYYNYAYDSGNEFHFTYSKC